MRAVAVAVEVWEEGGFAAGGVERFGETDMDMASSGIGWPVQWSLVGRIIVDIKT